jgi:diaminopimelate epimerase
MTGVRKRLPFWKAHAYGNDFLYASADDAAGAGMDAVDLARRLCARHTGVGADGLILYERTAGTIRMRLLNADGSPSEVSGNGVRGLAAIVAEQDGTHVGDTILIDTDAGTKALTLLGRDADGRRHEFRADMGKVADLRPLRLRIGDDVLEGVALRVGNPQFVVLDRELSEPRLHRIGPVLQAHAAFPDGVNVELAVVEAPDRVRILIWERGVGPTESSGTGSCASGVAAAAFGGAARVVDVLAPGGVQRVEWAEDGRVFLTGWAETLAEGVWRV